jgi:hypothetical protein
MNHTNIKLYKYIIYKTIIKFCIFIIFTIQNYYSFNENEHSNKIKIEYPFSAYTSILFFCINTNIFIEIPFMILAINSFLVWSISQNRMSIINFLDLLCILWIMICYISCLNYTKTYYNIFKHRLCNNIIHNILIYINDIVNFVKLQYKTILNITKSDEKLLNLKHTIITSESGNSISSITSMDSADSADLADLADSATLSPILTKQTSTDLATISNISTKSIKQISTDLATISNISTISTKQTSTDLTTSTDLATISTTQTSTDQTTRTDLYMYFNYEYLLIPIDISFILYIIIVLNTSIKQQSINFLNDNIHTIIGSLNVCSLLVVPAHYNNMKFLIAYLIMIIGFLIKILYLFDIINIDLATGLFHICIAVSCQLFSIVINDNC